MVLAFFSAKTVKANVLYFVIRLVQESIGLERFNFSGIQREQPKRCRFVCRQNPRLPLAPLKMRVLSFWWYLILQPTFSAMRRLFPLLLSIRTVSTLQKTIPLLSSFFRNMASVILVLCLTSFFLFPSIYRHHYPIWPVSVTQFGWFPLPNLAGFHYPIWLFLITQIGCIDYSKSRH